MRRATLLFVLAAIAATGCGGIHVTRLSLRDPRLPQEARSWLADAEDEVAISRSRVDDAQRELDALARYGEIIDKAVEQPQFRKNGGEQVAKQLQHFLEQRRDLKKLELDTALTQLRLSRMRLLQARAETAIRYDIAVYEMDEISAEVEKLKAEVATAQRKVEGKRVAVEQTADKMWQSYGGFVQKGGMPNSLWSAREASQ